MVAIDLVLKFLHVNHTASSQIRPRMIFLDQVVLVKPESLRCKLANLFIVYKCFSVASSLLLLKHLFGINKKWMKPTPG